MAVSGAVVDDLLRLSVSYRSEARGGCDARVEGIHGKLNGDDKE